MKLVYAAAVSTGVPSALLPVSCARGMTSWCGRVVMIEPFRALAPADARS